MENFLKAANKSGSMKDVIAVLVITLLAYNSLRAQTSKTITNDIVIKMVKANMTDDLIVDQINDPDYKVNFNLSTDSLQFLYSQKVSPAVIEVMKEAESKVLKANGAKPDIAAAKPAVTEKPVLPLKDTVRAPLTAFKKDTIKPLAKMDTIIVPKKTTIQTPVVIIKDTLPNKTKEKLPNKTALANKTEVIDGGKISQEKSIFRITVVSYINPVKELIAFYNNQLLTLTGFTYKWGRQVKDSLEREKQIQQMIEQDEKVLANKLNANDKGFSNDILALKNKLSQERSDNKRLKINIVNDGKILSNQLKTLNKEMDGLINDKFNEISKAVKNSHPTPSVPNMDSDILIPKQKFDPHLLIHVTPLNVILTWYENSIISLLDTIPVWNQKALAVIDQYSKLSKQFEPANQQLAKYLSTPKYNQKLYKNEIANLKKQSIAFDNDRKRLAARMVDDSKSLSVQLIQMKEAVRMAIKERFLDAIENIDNSYGNIF